MQSNRLKELPSRTFQRFEVSRGFQRLPLQAGPSRVRACQTKVRQTLSEQLRAKDDEFFNSSPGCGSGVALWGTAGGVFLEAREEQDKARHQA